MRNRGTKSKALIALGLVCFFWGTTWIASKQGVKHMPALQLAGIRQFLGGLAYLLYFTYKGRVLPRWNEWKSIFILSFLNFFLSNGLSTWGVKYISAGLGAIIAAAFPLWLVVISLFGKKSKLSVKALIGFGLGFGGICVIFYENLHNFLNPEFTFGIILSIAATWSWAFGTIYTKEQAKSFNPYFSLGWQMFISGIALGLTSKVTGMWIPMKSIPWQSWTAISYLVIFGSVISFIAYLYALQNLSAEQTSVYAYINPVVAVLLGTLLFDEHMTSYILFGGLITLYGVYLINKAFKKGRI
jgi:drug/metabolite transporter (DMT)-like permease